MSHLTQEFFASHIGRLNRKWLDTAKSRSQTFFDTDLSVLSLLLVIIFAAACYEFLCDGLEANAWLHLSSALIISVSALAALLLVGVRKWHWEARLQVESKRLQALQDVADSWRVRHEKITRGLGQAIEDQFNLWRFTPAEKEVASLLLKGLGTKEIANVRSTCEKTSRQQCLSIYAKADVGGRAELSAFFLEDLLLPLS